MLKNGVEAFRKDRLKVSLQFNSGKVDEGQSIRSIADGNEFIEETVRQMDESTLLAGTRATYERERYDQHWVFAVRNPDGKTPPA